MVSGIFQYCVYALVGLFHQRSHFLAKLLQVALLLERFYADQVLHFQESQTSAEGVGHSVKLRACLLERGMQIWKVSPPGAVEI